MMPGTGSGQPGNGFRVRVRSPSSAAIGRSRTADTVDESLPQSILRFLGFPGRARLPLWEGLRHFEFGSQCSQQQNRPEISDHVLVSRSLLQGCKVFGDLTTKPGLFPPGEERLACARHAREPALPGTTWHNSGKRAFFRPSCSSA